MESLFRNFESFDLMTELLLTTDDWLELQNLVTETDFFKTKISQSHRRTALDVLHRLLVKLFGTPSITRLCEQKQPKYEFCTQISVTLTDIIGTYSWSRKTAQKVLVTVRKILNRTEVKKSVIRAIKLQPLPKSWNTMLGKKYGRLKVTDPQRVLLEGWVQILRQETNNKSPASLRNIMYFYMYTVVPALNLNIETWAQGVIPATTTVAPSETMIRKMCGQGHGIQRKAIWLQIFLTHILKSSFLLPKHLKSLGRQRMLAPDEDDDGSDHHRISKEDLETLYAVAKKNLLDEMLFLTMLTTGIRIGGYACIKSRRVAELKNGKWSAREQGSTIDKGRKVYSFKIQKRVGTLFKSWLNNHRPFNPSVYLQPGRAAGQPISTSSIRQRFQVICTKAGLKGTEFHPHALRHCYSHILLELGNPIEIVSKLINHSNVATTEKFYLKESAAEVSARAHIPWLKTPGQKRKPHNPVPAFLSETVGVSKKRKTADNLQEQRKKLKHQLETLSMFQATVTTS